MKKFLYIPIVGISMLFLSACSSDITQEDHNISISESIVPNIDSKQPIQEMQNTELFSDTEDLWSKTLPQEDESSWSYIIDNYPLTTYDEIKAGNYGEEYAILSATVDSVEYSELLNWVNCDVWFAHENSYICDSIIFHCDELVSYDPQTLQPGDNIDICFFIYTDNSFGSKIKGVNTNANTTSLEEIYTSFKQTCSPLNWEEIMRNPDVFWGYTYSFTGNVFQIISEKDGSTELLLFIDNDKYIHISYTYKDNESRILENDTLTVYGTYYKLYEYVSVLGTKKTVPSIAAEFVDIN